MQVGQMLGQAMLGLNHQFGCGGRSRRAQIGDKVSNGEIGLMADGRDHRDRGRGDSPSEFFVVERRQVFQRAAAASDDNDVNISSAVEILDSGSNLRGRGFTLHLRRINENTNALMPPGKDIQHVVKRSSARRGHKADAARQGRNRLATRRVEQAFFGESGLELLKGQLQRAGAYRLQKFGGKLKFAARVVDGDAAAGDDLHAVVRPEAEQTRLAAEHHDAQLCITVFEREVEMPGFGGSKIGYLAFYPHIRVAALHRSAHGAHQIGHAPYTAGKRLIKGETELAFKRHLRQFNRRGAWEYGYHSVLWPGDSTLSDTTADPHAAFDPGAVYARSFAFRDG